MQRTTDPTLWGPLSPQQLIEALAQAHNRHADYCARWGRRNTHAYLVGHLLLWDRHRQGLTLQLCRLPWHAQQAAAQLQLQGVWA